MIDKTRRSNLDDIEYADEASNPMYECIDPDNDSMIDPLYSKVERVDSFLYIFIFHCFFKKFLVLNRTLFDV